MLKKAKAAMSEGATGEAKDLAKSVLDSSHQIWLAGIGAFMRAQKGGMKVFEDRVARALGKLGVYTQNDIQKLAERVDALSAAVNELLKASGAKPVAASKRKAPARAQRPGPKKSAAATASPRARKRPAKPRSAA
jgi:polyhydroxyalkanoate synthesis regulator phasin